MKRSVSELGLTFEPHILVFRDMTFVIKKHKSLFVKKHDEGKRSLRSRLKLLILAVIIKLKSNLLVGVQLIFSSSILYVGKERQEM